MEIESKYYTPEIEEFHVGFEYQVEDLHDNLVDKTWRYDKMNSGTDLMILEEWLKKDEIRVKHLDREDIESLGWKCEEEFNDGRMSFLGLFKSQRKGLLTQHSIMYVKSTNWCLIANEEDKTMFCGTIKNKSELKRILKQINI